MSSPLDVSQQACRRPKPCGVTEEPMPVILQADARALPLADDSVDLVVTSPPYYGQRSYKDSGQHYEGQIGAEPTVAEYLDALLDVTRECMRVLKPNGSVWVNLGDKYATRYSSWRASGRAGLNDDDNTRHRSGPNSTGVQEKSLLGLPWRYALRCLDELGLILRAEVIWSKPNGLPESVTDRVRRSHEHWFHFTVAPRYYSAVDEIREPHALSSLARSRRAYHAGDGFSLGAPQTLNPAQFVHPVGKLPGSVWEIPTQPRRVPAELGVDHYAAFPMEWPRRLILGWSPREVCTACGQGRRPVVEAQRTVDNQPVSGSGKRGGIQGETTGAGNGRHGTVRRITGYGCACADTTAPTMPGVVLDPFGGTGTTALVAVMHGRTGISIDASADYCRLAQWRANNPRRRAKAAASTTLRTQPRRPHCQIGHPTPHAGRAGNGGIPHVANIDTPPVLRRLGLTADEKGRAA